MRYVTRWPGEQADMLDLLQIVQRNCTCTLSNHGTDERVCAAHMLLTGDQLAINRLAFVRSIADRLRTEEFDAAELSAN